jgi:membrane associated rhomboid family serine protease
MGLENRDYARDSDRGFQLQAPQTAVGTLILINVVVFVLDLMSDGRLTPYLALTTESITRPWYCWQLLTYGFVHSTDTLAHVAFNMLGLFFLGRDVESLYGKREFLKIYLIAVVASGAAWVAVQFLPSSLPAYVVGASGAVMCVTVLFACNFPNRVILLFGILPVAAWVLCSLFILQDIWGAVANRHGIGGNTAYVAHLGGAALGLAYFRLGWNFNRWTPRRFKLPNVSKVFERSPKLKVHEPNDDPPPLSLEAEMDRILVKINETGFDSLSPEERHTLERASARFQKRRQ